MAITTDIDRFRLELGDTPAAYGLGQPRPVPDTEFEAAALFNDDEVTYFLTAHPGSVLLAVAAACDALALRFAQEVDETEDGQSFKLSQKAARFQSMATRLRARATAEVASSIVGAGVPVGRVPARQATRWSEVY